MSVSPPPPEPLRTTIDATGTRRRMRVSWIVWGVLFAVGALAVTIGAAVAILVDKTASALDSEAEARTPGTARFDADDATYEVLLVRSRHDTSPAAAGNVVCAVNLANERTITLGGSRQATSTEAANTATIGTFDAVAGQTAVTCDADGGEVRFVVDKVSTVGRIANWVLLAGIAALLAAAGLILGGIFWKRTT